MGVYIFFKLQWPFLRIQTPFRHFTDPVNSVTDSDAGLGQNDDTMQWIQIMQSISGAWLVLNARWYDFDPLLIKTVSWKRIFAKRNQADGIEQNLSFD
jgi:hypothetical protein